MQAETFEQSLLALIHRRPFQSFTVELLNGKYVEVDHPEAMVCHDGLAVFIGKRGVLHIFEADGVNRVINAKGEGANSNSI